MKKLIIITILFAGLSGCGSLDNMAKYRKLQKSAEYDARIKFNDAFTVISAKRALKQLKLQNKAKAKREREAAKRDAIYAQIKKLKDKNQ